VKHPAKLLKILLAQHGSLTDSTAQPDAVKRRGVVIGCEDSIAYIKLFPVAGCVGCERMQRLGYGPGHCGIDLLGLSRLAQNPTIEIPIHTIDGIADGADLRVGLSAGLRVGLRVGDTVEVLVQAPNATWVLLASRVYGLPTFGLMLGATIGSLVGEPVAIGLAALGLFAGLWFGRRSGQLAQSMSELLRPEQPSMRIVNKVIEEI